MHKRAAGSFSAHTLGGLAARFVSGPGILSGPWDVARGRVERRPGLSL
jgi:hypothetical protein